MRIGFFVLFLVTGLCICPPGLAAELGGMSADASKVVVVEDPRATEAFQPRSEVVRTMVRQGLLRLTGSTNEAQAWRSLVSTQDTIGIKVLSAPGRSGTRPAVAAAIIEGLLQSGIRAQKIVVWDKRLEDLRCAGFSELARKYHVRLAGSADAGYDEAVEGYDSPLLGNLVWGEAEFGRKGDKVGRRSFISKLLTQDITKIVNIAPVLNHNAAGIHGTLCSLALAGVDNTQRFESSAERLATAIPDIYGLPELSDRVVLNIMDALICQYRGGQSSLLHYATSLNQIWLSKDPVALDVLGIQELERERQAADVEGSITNMELYRNATLLKLGNNDSSRIRVDLAK